MFNTGNVRSTRDSLSLQNLVTKVIIVGKAEENKMTDHMQKSSIYFDFEKGDFLLDNAGRIKTDIPYDT